MKPSRILGGSQWGLLAQVFTFVSLFVPIVFGLAGVVVFTVQVGAIVTVVVQSTTLAIEARLPTVLSPREARAILRSGQIVLAACVLVVAGFAGALYLGTPNGHWGPTVLAVAILLSGQGLYVVELAILTRRLDYGAMMFTRLGYGISTLVFTCVLAVLRADPVLFVCATSCSYVIAVGVGRLVSHTRGTAHAIERGRISLAEFSGQLRVSRALVTSYFLGGLAGQAGALSVGLVGPFQPAWAVVCRMMGGFQTVAGQVAGPRVDIAVAEEVQRGAWDGLSTTIRRSYLVGGSLALAQTFFALVGIWWVHGGQALSPASLLALAIGAVGYAGAATVMTPSARTLGMIGRHNVRLMWDAFRSVATIVAIVFFRDDWLLIVLGALGVATTVSYFVLSLRAAHSQSSNAMSRADDEVSPSALGATPRRGSAN